jgi:hypothetical protein
MAERLLQISAHDAREFQLVVLALRQYVDRDLAAGIRKAARSTVEPLWREAVDDSARKASAYLPRGLAQRVFARTARAAVADRNVTLRAAGTGKPLSGGFDYREREWGALEFGTKARQRTTTYPSTSRRGRHYIVHDRHTRRQLPVRRAKGWVFYPAAEHAIPRIAALYAQTAIRGLHEALEAGNG